MLLNTNMPIPCNQPIPFSTGIAGTNARFQSSINSKPAIITRKRYAVSLIAIASLIIILQIFYDEIIKYEIAYITQQIPAIINPLGPKIEPLITNDAGTRAALNALLFNKFFIINSFM
jgi:hypothetical protein